MLKAGSNNVAMATGDAILTAIHVAGEVDMTSSDRSKVLILETEEEETGDGSTREPRLVWRNLQTKQVEQAYRAADLPALGRARDLCLTGEMLTLAAERDAETWQHLEHIRVFARMTPERKERVLLALKETGHFTMMCGDGANDVGALKQAHVGIALLSGFKNSNVEKLDAEGKKIVPKDAGMTPQERMAKAKAEHAKKLKERQV